MREGSKRDLARRLRRELTPHEQKLWYLLRDRRFSGVKFRRQVPIGPYIADFAAVACKLIVELDGGQHAESRQDGIRDAYLESEGWTVLRFWNSDMDANREGVLARIAEHLPSAPPRPRQG